MVEVIEVLDNSFCIIFQAKKASMTQKEGDLYFQDPRSQGALRNGRREFQHASGPCVAACH